MLGLFHRWPLKNRVGPRSLPGERVFSFAPRTNQPGGIRSHLPLPKPAGGNGGNPPEGAAEPPIGPPGKGGRLLEELGNPPGRPEAGGSDAGGNPEGGKAAGGSDEDGNDVGPALPEGGNDGGKGGKPAGFAAGPDRGAPPSALLGGSEPAVGSDAVRGMSEAVGPVGAAASGGTTSLKFSKFTTWISSPSRCVSTAISQIRQPVGSLINAQTTSYWPTDWPLVPGSTQLLVTSMVLGSLGSASCGTPISNWA